MHRKIILGMLTLSVIGLAFVGWAVWASGVFESPSPSPAPANSANTQSPDMANQANAALIARGKYLANAGDCIACHTAPGTKPLSGGLAMATPYGTLYSPNITPDKRYGIGNWTEPDFWRAMHNGISPGNTLLYPVFPYVNFTYVSRPDVDAIFAYLRTIEPVAQPNKPNQMAFPFNYRATLVFWRALFFRPHTFIPNPDKSTEWNRGAYLVKGLGHCSMCHTSFNALGATTASASFAGGLIPAEHWYAPALNASKQLGLGSWTNADIVKLLKTGVSRHGAVYGPMAVVVEDSLQHLSDSDLNAIAIYLRAQPILRSPTDKLKGDVSPKLAATLFDEGHQLYTKHCLACHQANGEGIGDTFPPLASNPSIAAQPGTNAIRMVLLGATQPKTEGNPHPASMPPFAQALNDHEIAAVVTYIRHAWGNNAPAVAPVDVTRLRQIPSQ
jgi:mono/diheme cytochrome c family protein